MFCRNFQGLQLHSPHGKWHGAFGSDRSRRPRNMAPDGDQEEAGSSRKVQVSCLAVRAYQQGENEFCKSSGTQF